MTSSEERRYSISEVSKTTGVSITILRRWEERYSPMLKPKRDKAGRRYYVKNDIDIVRRLKQYVKHEQLTTAGARKRLAMELRGEGRPATGHETVELARAIEAELSELLDMLESD